MNLWKVKKYDDYLESREEYPINENEDKATKDREVKARIKVNKALVWLNINRGFFGRLLGNLNIYGVTSDRYKTMATNGLHIIYHPDFVLSQSEEAIRFVLCHEVLHCVGNHSTRRGTRDPKIWNYAADYAINPILDQEKDRKFEWPVDEKGERIGLLEEKYNGWRAEDIYDDLIKNAEKIELPMSSNFGEVIDSDDDMPGPDSADSIVQDVRGEEEESDIPAPGQPGDEEGEAGGGGGQGDKDGGDEEGGGGHRSLIGKTVTVTDGPNKGMTGVVKNVFPNGDIEIG